MQNCRDSGTQSPSRIFHAKNKAPHQAHRATEAGQIRISSCRQPESQIPMQSDQSPNSLFASCQFPGTPSCSPSCHASPSPPWRGSWCRGSRSALASSISIGLPRFMDLHLGFCSSVPAATHLALAHFRLQGFSGLPLLTAFLVCFLPPTLQGCSSCVLLVCPSPDPASPKAQGVACKAVLQDILMLRCRRS